MGAENFISLGGLFVLIFLAWVISRDRQAVNWHVVVWGISLQLLFAWFLFVFPAGTKFFLWTNTAVVEVLDASLAGSKFVFGNLGVPPGMQTGETSVGFILAFQAFPAIIFFSALMSILYFFNIMPRLIKAFAHLFTKLMKVSGAESLCAASNIFVGVESTLTVKPFLKDMTRSELCTVLAAGMATVSSNVLALYVFSLQDVFPNIAGHLVSASFLSAPAALAMAKVIVPETESPRTLGENIEPHVGKEANVIEAVINGANAGVRLIVGIVALLIAVLGLVALLDKGLAFLGENVFQSYLWLDEPLSLKVISGWIFTPLVALLGVPWGDIPVLSQIIGERLVITEVAAYADLAEAIRLQVIGPRSAVVATYALCGFAHVASLAIFIGGIAALVPEKTKELSRVGGWALIAATFACLMTACVAGVFFVEGTTVLMG